LAENFADVAIEVKRFGRGSQTSAGASALEQRLPELLLKRLEPRGDRGLGNTQAFGRLDDTAAVNNRNKKAQVLNLHRIFLCLSIGIIYFPMRDANGT
jgi:hypothetical protein